MDECIVSNAEKDEDYHNYFSFYNVNGLQEKKSKNGHGVSGP